MITAIQDRLDISLAEMKSYLRITVTSTAEDNYLTSCIETAKAQADLFCQNEFTLIDSETGIVTELAIPSSIKGAVMQIASTLYTERNDHMANTNLIGYSYTQGTPNWNAFRQLQPYRKYYV